MIRVAVVAPVPAWRAGLRAMLEATGEIQVVAEAASPAELDRSLDIEEVIAVLGSVPLGSAGRVWRSLGEGRPVLFLVDTLASAAAVRALSLPVYGVLPLQASGEALRAAARALREGLIVWAPGLLSPVAPHPAVPVSQGEEEATERLTPREIEVLRLLAEGLANKEIAARLGISEHTVKFHLSAIYSKLGATNRAEAVRMGLRRGLIPL